jgi:hypothetical protein
MVMGADSASLFEMRLMFVNLDTDGFTTGAKYYE